MTVIVLLIWVCCLQNLSMNSYQRVAKFQDSVIEQNNKDFDSLYHQTRRCQDIADNLTDKCFYFIDIIDSLENKPKRSWDIKKLHP